MKSEKEERKKMPDFGVVKKDKPASATPERQDVEDDDVDDHGHLGPAGNRNGNVSSPRRNEPENGTLRARSVFSLLRSSHQASLFTNFPL